MENLFISSNSWYSITLCQDLKMRHGVQLWALTPYNTCFCVTHLFSSFIVQGSSLNLEIP